jgi:hypothetical protein
VSGGHPDARRPPTDRATWYAARTRVRLPWPAKAMFGSRRGPVALLTNAVSSAGNLMVAIVVARGESIDGLGAFALAFSAYALVVGLSRAAVTESALALPSAPGRYARSAGRVLMIGMVASALILAAGLTFGNGYLTLVALALPGLAAYDYVKTVSLGAENPTWALVQETVWLSLTVVVAIPGLLGGAPALFVFGAWAVSGSCIGLVCVYLRGYHLVPGWGVGRAETRVSLSFGIDFLAGSGSAHLTMAVLTAVCGTAVVGALRGAGTILAPVALVVSTARPLVIPLLARASTAQAGARARTAVSLTVGLVVVVSVIATALVLLPDPVGRILVGDNWRFAKPLLPAIGGEMVLTAAAVVAFAAHRVERAGNRTLAIRGAVAPVRIATVVGAGALLGAQGAAVALAVMAFLGAVIWWWSYAALPQRSGLDAP